MRQRKMVRGRPWDAPGINRPGRAMVALAIMRARSNAKGKRRYLPGGSQRIPRRIRRGDAFLLDGIPRPRPGRLFTLTRQWAHVFGGGDANTSRFAANYESL